ncbi:MAG TPA: putative lipid II flippase FtsW [Chthoniobacteraceae bacterium]|nr:putative lipid II flippase FtsW [Chthoniobacteraceae bacterium]
MYRKSVYFLVIAVAIITVLGIVMLFSTSAFAQGTHGDEFYFVKRQAMWLGLGAVACVIGSMLDYHFWQRHCWVLFGVAALLLTLCLIPHVGLRINGSWRWLGAGPIRFQPSDMEKLAAVSMLAWWYTKYEKETKEALRGFIWPALVMGVPLLLIMRETDMGTTALLAATMFVVMFVAGARLLYLAPLPVAGLAGMLYLASHMKGRSERLLAFLDLEKYADGAGLQQLQALIAFGSGGVGGLGLGNGRQRFSYLPEAHTDFIFPTLGEELGLRFTLLVIFCYIMIILCGTLISMQARDRFGMLLGFGIVSLVSIQAAVNIGVTTALLPNKGIALPFISYGGSNLLFCMLCVGILINIYRQGVGEKPSDKTTTRLRSRVTPRI